MGSGVDLEPGTRVFGLAAGSLGTAVLASHKTMIPIPANISFEQAATASTVFITVEIGFGQTAAVSSSDTVREVKSPPPPRA